MRVVHFELNSGTSNHDTPQKVRAVIPKGLNIVPLLLLNPRIHTNIAMSPLTTNLCLNVISSVMIFLTSVMASGT